MWSRNQARISVQTPKGQQWQELKWNIQSFGKCDLLLDDFDTEEHGAMHVMGVIMAQQYTI
jgi:hypothetical protein